MSVMAPKKNEPHPVWTAKKIRALRDRLDLTQKEMAARLRISQSQLSSFEKGHRSPTRPIAYLLELLDSETI